MTTGNLKARIAKLVAEAKARASDGIPKLTGACTAYYHEGDVEAIAAATAAGLRVVVFPGKPDEPGPANPIW
jgi:hypothetical protein